MTGAYSGRSGTPAASVAGIGLPARRVNEIVHGQRRISADTALRLAWFFGTSELLWINLQSRYDLEAKRIG